MDNSLKKLIVNMSLQTGKYVFDDGNQVKVVPIANCEDVTYNTEDEIMEEYGFSEDLVEQVDCFVYNGLKDIDEQNGSNYTVKYLNMIAHDIEREPREFKRQYKNRVVQIRKQILEDIGLELNYDVAIKGASKDLSLSDKLFMKKVAQKQEENGANVDIHHAYKNTERSLESDEEMVSDNISEDSFDYHDDVPSFSGTKSQEEDRYERTVVNSGEQQYEIRVDTRYATSFDRTYRAEKDEDGERKKTEPYNIKIRKKDRSKFKNLDTQILVEEKKEEVLKNTDVLASKDVKEEGNIEAQVLEGEETVDTNILNQEEGEQLLGTENEVLEGQEQVQSEESKILEDDDDKKAQDVKNNILQYKSKNEKGLQFFEIKDGKMLGVDENRPSAIVERFTIERPNIEKPQIEKIEVISFETRKPQTEKAEIKEGETRDTEFEEDAIKRPKKQGRVKRFIRKFKNKEDKIQNKVFVSRNNIKKFIITGVVSILALASVVEIGAKVYSNMKARTQYTTEQEKESAGNTESDSRADKENEPTESAQDLNKDMNVQEESRMNTQSSKINVQQDTQGKKQQLSEGQKENENIKNVTYDKKNKKDASTEYLKSVRVGTRMKINTGTYFETPEGTGKVGYFRSHKGKEKIISKIGIATKEGYTSISSPDVSLLELKQKYPDAEFSYHIVDEKGHIFGWMTSKSFSKYVSKDQIQMDDER